MKNNYWENVNEMQRKQALKGIEKYGQTLEENIKMTPTERLVYMQEELVDALMYLEHYKVDNYPGMDADDYQQKALRTANLTTMKESLAVAALGIAGEGGEVADHIKKHISQGHELDEAYIAKELGDVCWYVATMAHVINYSFGDILKMNIEKLEKRYPNGFDVEKSINRAEGDE